MKKLFSLVNIPSSESETAQLVNTFLMSLSKRFQKESTRFLSCTGNLANSCSGASHRKSQHCMHCFWQCTCTAHAVWAYIGIECEEVVIPSYAVVCQFLKLFSRCHDCWHRQMEGCHMTHTHTFSHTATLPALLTSTLPKHPSPPLYPSTPQPSLYPSTPQPSLYPSTPQPSLYPSTPQPSLHSTQVPLTLTLPQHPSTLTLPQHPSTLTPLYSSTSHPHSTPAPLNPQLSLYPSTPQPSLYPSTPQPSLYPSTPHPPAPPVAFGTS